jgi:WD40 repeat protein
MAFGLCFVFAQFCVWLTTPGVAGEEHEPAATISIGGEHVRKVVFASDDQKVVVSQQTEAGRHASRRVGKGGWTFAQCGAITCCDIQQTKILWAVDMNKVLEGWPQHETPTGRVPNSAHVPAGLLSVSPDGKTVSTSSVMNPIVRVWDAEKGRCTRTLAFGQPGARFRQAMLTAPAYSPDGRTLAALCHRHDIGVLDMGQVSLVLWDAKTSKVSKSLTFPTKELFWPSGTVIWSRDAKKLVSQGNKAIHVWEAAPKLRLLRKIEYGDKTDFAMCFADRTEHLVTISRPNLEIDNWDLNAGNITETVAIEKAIRQKIADVQLNYTVAFSADGNRAALPLAKGNFAVIDTRTGKALAVFEANHRENVSSLAFSADGNRIASAGDAEAIVKIWRLPPAD